MSEDDSTSENSDSGNEDALSESRRNITKIDETDARLNSEISKSETRETQPEPEKGYVMAPTDNDKNRGSDADGDGDE